MMWAAVGCIVFALLLSMAGQFSHSWIVNNEQGSEGQSVGLTTIRQDCSVAEPDANETKQQAIDECKAFAYVLFAEDMETASEDDITVDDIGNVIVGEYEDYCDNIYVYGPLMMGDQDALANLSEISGHLPRNACCWLNRWPDPLARLRRRPAGHPHVECRLHW